MLWLQRFLLTVFSFADPVTGNVSWVAGDDGFNYSFDGTTSDVTNTVGGADFGVKIFKNGSTFDVTTYLADGAIKTIHEDLTDKADVYIDASSGAVDGNVFLQNLSIYADDAAACIGGLVAGQLYHTALGALHVKL